MASAYQPFRAYYNVQLYCTTACIPNRSLTVVKYCDKKYLYY